MPKFFVTPEAIVSGRIVLPPEEAAHACKVLRLREGDEVTVCDGACTDYRCVIRTLSKDEVVCEIYDTEHCDSEPSLFVTLYMGLPKADKLKLVIQKAVELGVSRITPVLSARCVARPAQEVFEKRLKRYRQLALAAAKQSGRGCVPEVTPFSDLSEAGNRMAKDDLAFVLYERAGRVGTIPALEGKESISFLVGPEGGFEAEEIELLSTQGILPIGLGPRILRCETAPITFLSILMYLSGNF